MKKNIVDSFGIDHFISTFNRATCKWNGDFYVLVRFPDDICSIRNEMPEEYQNFPQVHTEEERIQMLHVANERARICADYLEELSRENDEDGSNDHRIEEEEDDLYTHNNRIDFYSNIRYCMNDLESLSSEGAALCKRIEGAYNKRLVPMVLASTMGKTLDDAQAIFVPFEELTTLSIFNGPQNPWYYNVEGATAALRGPRRQTRCLRYDEICANRELDVTLESAVINVGRAIMGKGYMTPKEALKTMLKDTSISSIAVTPGLRLAKGPISIGLKQTIAFKLIASSSSNNSSQGQERLRMTISVNEDNKVICSDAFLWKTLNDKENHQRLVNAGVNNE